MVAADGHQLTNDSASESGARRFLGWTNKKHWLLADG